MVIQTYADTRPYLYHLTDCSNVGHIIKTNKLLSAATWMEHAGREDLLTRRRHAREQLTVGGL